MKSGPGIYPRLNKIKFEVYRGRATMYRSTSTFIVHHYVCSPIKWSFHAAYLEILKCYLSFLLSTNWFIVLHHSFWSSMLALMEILDQSEQFKLNMPNIGNAIKLQKNSYSNFFFCYFCLRSNSHDIWFLPSSPC